MSVSVLFYVQHLLGVGHLVRASLVAEALTAAGAEVTLVTGGRPVTGFPGPGIDVVALPPVSAGEGGFSDLVDRNGQPIDDAFREDRRRQLLAAFERTRPEIVMIEAYPFGRRQMRFELKPLLAAARAARPRPLVACSVRDILQERTADKNRQTADELKAAFDLVLVHADPTFARLEETFPLAGEIADKIRYTGIVSAEPGELDGDGAEVVVSAGGGVVGERLIRAAIGAKPLCSLSSARWCIITGPNLDAQISEDLAANADPGIDLHVSRRDFRALLAGSELSISQAGYNTAADVLRAGCRAIMVPYAAGHETEQTLRAEKLAGRGLVAALCEADLTAEALAAAIDERMKVPRIAASHDIDLSGAQTAARILIKSI